MEYHHTKDIHTPYTLLGGRPPHDVSRPSQMLSLTTLSKPLAIACRTATTMTTAGRQVRFFPYLRWPLASAAAAGGVFLLADNNWDQAVNPTDALRRTTHYERLRLNARDKFNGSTWSSNVVFETMPGSSDETIVLADDLSPKEAFNLATTVTAVTSHALVSSKEVNAILPALFDPADLA